MGIWIREVLSYLGMTWMNEWNGLDWTVGGFLTV